jgi:hypothetical protein
MENSYYGDTYADLNDDYNGDPFVGAPSTSAPAKRMKGTSRIAYIDCVQGKVTSTTLPSPVAGYAAARLKYFMQRMSDFGPFRTTVFTAVPNSSGIATVTINAEDLQTDSAYTSLQKFIPFVYFTFGASPTSAVPASQSSITINSFDALENSLSTTFAIERNTAQMTKVRFTQYRLLFGKPVADNLQAFPSAAAKSITLTVTGLVGNANFSVEVPGLNDKRLAQAFSSLNAS